MIANWIAAARDFVGWRFCLGKNSLELFIGTKRHGYREIAPVGEKGGRHEN
jgi:hypothetical protein